MGIWRGVVVVVSVAVLGACGGGGTKTSPASTAASSGSETESTVAGDVNIDKTISSVLEVGTGQRGKKEDAPGKVRFANYLAKGGKAIDLDVWWGKPDEGQKAATVKFGEVSPYLTPKRTKGFTSAPYAITAVGSTQSLFEWDRFEPVNGTQRTVIWSYDGENLSEFDVGESLTLIEGGRDRPEFAAPTTDKVKLRWIVLGSAIEVQDDLLRVRAGEKCLTNGTQIADPNDELGNSLSDFSIDTFDVEPGAALNLAVGCTGAASGTAVTAPAKGRGLAIAYLDPAGKGALALVPVADAP
jgi:hypothetical protein